MNSFSVTKLFFTSRFGGQATDDDVGIFSKLVDEFSISGYCIGLERAKEIYRGFYSGGCRMLSQGDHCTCFLCKCDEAKSESRGLK